MRVIVCGGRDFTDREHLYRALDQFHAETPIAVLIHGCAAGADTLADEWAFARKVSTLKFPAHWERHGRKAGILRNREMLHVGKPDAVICFPGERGTADMASRATEARVPVHWR